MEEEKKEEARESNLPATVDATRGMLESIGKMDFEGILELGDTLVKTGFLPDAIKTGAQAAAIILKGAELHVPPMQALETIHIIKGKPSMAAQLMLGLCFQRIKGFKAQRIEASEKACTWVFQRPGNPEHKETFTIERAAKMKTKEGGKVIAVSEKFNWKTMPKVMLEWRCISAGLRLVAPDIIMGLYTPEELDPDVKIINADTGEIEMVQAEATVKDIDEVPNGERMSLQDEKPAPEPTVIPEEPEPKKPTRGEVKAILQGLPTKEFTDLCAKCDLDPINPDSTAQEANLRKLWVQYKKGVDNG